MAIFINVTFTKMTWIMSNLEEKVLHMLFRTRNETFLLKMALISTLLYSLLMCHSQKDLENVQERY